MSFKRWIMTNDPAGDKENSKRKRILRIDEPLPSSSFILCSSRDWKLKATKKYAQTCHVLTMVPTKKPFSMTHHMSNDPNKVSNEKILQNASPLYFFPLPLLKNQKTSKEKEEREKKFVQESSRQTIFFSFFPLSLFLVFYQKEMRKETILRLRVLDHVIQTYLLGKKKREEKKKKEEKAKKVERVPELPFNDALKKIFALFFFLSPFSFQKKKIFPWTIVVWSNIKISNCATFGSERVLSSTLFSLWEKLWAK